MEKKLQRDENNKMIAGVCAGLAEYFNIDITIIRAVFLLALLLHGTGVGLYIVLWIVMPKKLYGFRNYNNAGPVDYTVPPQSNAGPIDYSVPNAFGNYTAGEPFAMPPKQKSNAGVIIGVALVVFGSFFLLDNFDLLPDWEFERLWPVVFIISGFVLVFSRKPVEPWEKDKVNFENEPSPDKTESTEVKEDKTEDTPPTL
jgi:phage shock protein C